MAIGFHPAPRHDHFARREHGDGGGEAGLVGIRANEDVTGGESAAGIQEARIDFLETERATLPHEDRPAVGQHGHLWAFLIAGTDLIHSERSKRAGEVVIEALRADAAAVTIGEAVLPDDIAAGRAKGQRRARLVAGLRTGK